MTFSVECANDPNTEAAPREELFRVIEDAVGFAESAATKYRAVWISETGRNTRTGGEDWFCFWWNPRAAGDGSYGQPEGRGRGYEYSKRWDALVEYEPIANFSD